MTKLPILLFFLAPPTIATLKPQTSLVTKSGNNVVCDFSVHRGGPEGPTVSGTSLDDELYYKIVCNKQPGQCLQVVNCTLSSDEPGFQPFPIIDDYGCSHDESLYKNVEYPTAFEAGIYNPFPVRFRATSSAAVLLFCVTSLVPMENTICTRRSCS